MKTKKIEVCNAVHISVNCAGNDSVDIRAGGPPMLGYDFIVSSDKNIEKTKKFIRECLKQYNRPFIGFSTRVREDFPVKHLWKKKMIKKCIEENGVC